MGSKAPSKLKLRRPTYKCNSCSKKFLSAQALKSHQYCAHKITGNSRPIRGKAKAMNMVGVTNKNQKPIIPKTVKEAKAIQNMLVKHAPVSPRLKAAVTTPSTANRRVEYECPICMKMFNSDFTASKHLQKFHNINDKGQKISSNSVEIIKPTVVEYCMLCRIRILPNEQHACSIKMVDKIDIPPLYECTGCKQKFGSIQLFNMHVSGLHCEGVESMFFPTMNDFTTWKADMEYTTKHKFMHVSNITSKQMFHCAFFLNIQKGKTEGASRICPSTIVIRQYSKGIQVHFYKKHYGHRSPEYTIPNKFKRYVITTLMDEREPASENELDVIDMFDDTDLYVQFKTLLDNIVIDAAKLKINHLKVLIGKALEMSTVLKQYTDEMENFDECQTPAPVQKTMTDEQITSALESFTKELKRKSSMPLDEPIDKIKRIPIVTATKIDISNVVVNNIDIEKPKGIPMTQVKAYGNKGKRSKTPMIVNTFSLADEQEEEKSVQIKTKPDNPIVKEIAKEVKFVKEVDSTPPKVNPIPMPISQVSSFNDSYKEFVDKNFVSKHEKTKTAKPTQQKNVMEKIKVLSKNDINDRIENKIPVHVNTNNNLVRNSYSVQPNVSLNNNQISENINIVNKNKITRGNANTKANYNKTKSNGKITILSNKKVKVKVKDNRKKVMKTKIGQYRPTLSPKKPQKIKKLRSSSNTSKSKADFEYEVKEQENDCNILILKI